MKKTKKTILISAGPTLEAIDPVRFISNRSSGKMGYALAVACRKYGHNVILVSGPTSLKKPNGCHFIAVTTAKEMEKALIKNFSKADMIFKVAAVADYAVKNPAKLKLKIKKNKKELKLTLVKNPDILKKLGKLKKKHQILVGFAAETHDILKHAQKKLKEKNLDWIVVNNVKRKDIGFSTDENEVILISRQGQKIKLRKQNKLKIAEKILKITIPRPSTIHPSLGSRR